MLEVCRKQEQGTEPIKVPSEDIFVTKYKEETTYEKGAKIIRRVGKKINVTKLVNESKKMIKKDNVTEKLNELAAYFSKETK